MGARLMYAEIGQCATPGCKDTAGYGLFLTMCQPHADNLARIRAEYEAEARGTCPSVGNGLNKAYGRPVCCTPGCNEPRQRGRAFCDVCEVMGAMEEAA